MAMASTGVVREIMKLSIHQMEFAADTNANLDGFRHG
jgi:hypothetical protein